VDKSSMLVLLPLGSMVEVTLPKFVASSDQVIALLTIPLSS
jgi:hypothetical protein